MRLTDKIEVFNEDCMETMSRYPDNFFDLAIVDPPYGINVGGAKASGKVGGGGIVSPKTYKTFDDSASPNKIYFDELMRVSKNQICWGANHYISKIPMDSSCWIVWDKDNTGHFADSELAWTSFNTAVRNFKWRWNGLFQQDMKNKEFRIHPTQKPVKLYQWLLEKYAQPDFKILDTHLGSGSSLIAAHYFRCEVVGAELDPDYFNAMVKRFKEQTAQKRMFA